jgi:hypothetical protein
MKRRLSLIMLITLVVISLFLWSPWINEAYAKERAVAEFERAWLNVADGCGFGCHGCGAAAWKKVPFGAQVTLEFTCGMSPADAPAQYQQVNVYVSPLGKVYGLPTP